MSDDLTRSHGGALVHGQLSSDKIISLALQAIEASREDIRRSEQTFVDRDTALVVEIRTRDGRALQLGFEQFPEH